MLSLLFIATVWSPAGKGLTSLLLFVMFNCVFITFPCGILGQVWYLIVSFPDLGRISYLDIFYWPNMCPSCRRCKTERVFSSHGGFLACVKLESPFNKSAEKILIYMKDSLITILNGHIEFETLVDQVDVTTCKEIYSKKTCLNEFLVILSLIKPKN